MSIKDININIVLVVILIVVIGFFAGKYLFNVYGVKQPLTTELNTINGVEKVELIENNDQTDIKVYLESKVDFQKTFMQISQISGKELGVEKGNIIVGSNNNTYLDQMFYKIHLAIYEGISTNRFTVMKNNIEKSLSNSDIDYKLWVNNENVLLRLDGKGESLYRILSRNNKGGVDSG